VNKISRERDNGPYLYLETCNVLVIDVCLLLLTTDSISGSYPPLAVQAVGTPCGCRHVCSHRSESAKSKLERRQKKQDVYDLCETNQRFLLEEILHNLCGVFQAPHESTECTRDRVHTNLCNTSIT
jgi:hypothetical protein